MLVLGCAGLDEGAWHNRPRQDPDTLTVPKKWMLQSYVYNGEEKVTTGGGAYISFKPGNGFGGYDGVNWIAYSADGPAYEATPDGGFRFLATGVTSTNVAPGPEISGDLARREQLLDRVTSFECTGNTLILSDGTERNQLRYLANTR